MKAIKNLIGGLILVIVLIIIDREIGEEEMPRKRNKFVWAWICVLALAVLGLMNKCVNAQEAQVFRVPLAPGLIGKMACNEKDQLVILISSLYNLDSIEYEAALAHERIHEAQVRKIGSCSKANKAWEADPLASEVPAFCSELKQRMVNGNAIDVLTTFILYLQRRYTPTLSIDEIADKVEEFCLGRINAPP